MAKKGCGFLGGACKAVDAKCDGCDRVQTVGDSKYCKAFPDPSVRWRIGNCSMATHIKSESAKDSAKVRVGQQKQKKR
ncbi:MAG: PxxKW family cysteine-rich protein [Deltaproteobacteria bacterium]|nr:PxxKW family cysteine-rich protein [Deltaproteobacteria bacterium]MDR1296111.1 PxxKW family cysteine-rich protein [Deltaproteobacteria bacterium]